MVEDRLDPDHEKIVAPPAGLAVSVAVLPWHIVPLLVGAAVGVLLTVTDVV